MNMSNDNARLGSVVQIDMSVPVWGGCLMIVDEVRSWGCVCSMRIPGGRYVQPTFLRIEHGKYHVIGDAVYIFVEYESE